jgi:hypothetical protein
MHGVKVGVLLKADLMRGDRCIVPTTTMNAGAESFAERVSGALPEAPVITLNNFAE